MWRRRGFLNPARIIRNLGHQSGRRNGLRGERQRRYPAGRFGRRYKDLGATRARYGATSPRETSDFGRHGIRPESKWNDVFHVSGPHHSLQSQIAAFGGPESTIAIYTVVSSAWQKVSGSVVDPVAHTVSVPVSHFSVYAAVCPQYIGSGPLYDVVNLGTLPGDAGSTPDGISSDGKVVGFSTSSQGVLHAFLWANSNISNMGTRPGDIWAIAYAVNASGVAVGISLPDNSNAYPVQFYQGQVTQLETAFGLIEGSATAINDHGDYIVGNAISQGATVTQLVGFTRSTSSGALNNSGSIAGSLQSHAAIWTNGGITDVGLLPDYDSTEGTAISNNGSLVGNADIGGSGKPVGFLYQGGTMSKVSPVTGDNIARPTGVNDAGQVVGTSTLDDAGTHGFVYQNGVTQRLSDLIDPQSGWQITYAYGINNAGQIIAKGFNNGSQQAILLNPKTPPALGALAWFKPPVRKKR
jgi:probable HAF family extracellular repeat protein